MELFACQFYIVSHVDTIGSVEPIVTFIRGEFDSFCVGDDCAIELFLSDTGHGVEFEDVGNIGLEFQRLLTILIGTFIVFEMIFGECHEVPRLVKIGFQRRDSRKNLHRSDIISLVERAFVFFHELLDVVLCRKG